MVGVSVGSSSAFVCIMISTLCCSVFLYRFGSKDMRQIHIWIERYETDPQEKKKVKAKA